MSKRFMVEGDSLFKRNPDGSKGERLFTYESYKPTVDKVGTEFQLPGGTTTVTLTTARIENFPPTASAPAPAPAAKPAPKSRKKTTAASTA